MKKNRRSNESKRTAKQSAKAPGRRLPELRAHKRSGRCYATFSGVEVWFGKADDPDTARRFEAHLAQWLARGRQPEAPLDQGLTVKGMVARFLAHLETKYDEQWLRNNGPRLTYSLEPLLRLHGGDPAAGFSPLKLKGVRHAMIASGRLCRSEINARVQVMRQAFRWATSEELVPATVAHGLAAVDHLRRGEYGVREGRTRGPVAEEVVRETLEHLHPVAAALVELLWWTGARPSEVFGLRPADIDRSGDVWVASLREHKTARKGKVRELGFGPNAQAVLRPFLDRVPKPHADRPLFSPAAAMAEHQAEARAARKTPLWASHEQRYERERGRREPREFADRYTAGVLRRAIERAVGRANRERKAKNAEGHQPSLPMLPVWTPYQLRHAALTRIRLAQGLEVAKAVGGHASALMTEGYSQHAERELARRAAADMG
ncbi:MAG: site-specific integrase [Planctomycetes bacterium]|nr:site-specific integrase [Planctomycetota bacterium]